MNNLVSRESGGGLSRVDYYFHITGCGGAFRMQAKFCAANTYFRKSQRHGWNKIHEWAAYNLAHGTQRPKVPQDVIDEVRAQIISNVTVVAE